MAKNKIKNNVIEYEEDRILKIEMITYLILLLDSLYLPDLVALSFFLVYILGYMLLKSFILLARLIIGVICYT